MLRKRRILRDDWFVNPTRYLIIRSSYEFSSFVLPKYNSTVIFQSFNRSGGRSFILKEFFIRTIRSSCCLLFFEKKNKIWITVSFLVPRYLSSTISTRPLPNLESELDRSLFRKRATIVESLPSRARKLDRNRSHNWVDTSRRVILSRARDRQMLIRA